MKGVTVDRCKNGILTGSYRPGSPSDNLYDHLGEQVRPCFFTPDERLMDALFPEGGIERAEVFNISEDYEGWGDRFVGWSFRVQFTESERVWLF